MEKQGYILGLDASTVEVGYCIWDKETNNLIKLDHLSMPEGLTLLAKVVYFKKWLVPLLAEYPQVNEMVIEEAFKKMASRTSSDVLQMLAAINFSYQFVCFEAGLQTSTILVQRARFNAFESFKPVDKARAGGKDHKEQMFEYVFELLGKEYFPTKILKSGPNKGKEVPEKFCSDISDAFVVTVGFLNFRLKEQSKVSKVKKKK